MSVIKLEVPADNERALSAAASFFAQLAGKQGTIAPVSVADRAAALVKEFPLPEEPAATAEQDDSDDDTADPSAPTIVNGVEVDSAGLPWDRRIHSSAKSKIKDGTWKKLRGVDDALVAQVEAELRQSMSPTAPAFTAPQAGQSGVPAAAETQAPVPPAAPQDTAAAVAPAVSVPPAATNAAPVSFADAMKKYAAAKAKNVISDAQAAEFCQGKGLNGIASLSVCPAEIRGEFVAMVEALAAAAGVTL